MSRSIRRIGAATAVAGACALHLVAVALALPPGGAAPQPGTPPGTLTITTPTVTAGGDVGFCVTGIRVDTASGPVGQQFMLKFDDFGSYGIGPFTPAADGSLCATVSTDPDAYANAKGGAADKLPADLCDSSKEHWLRLLSGSWAHPEASQRSLAATFAAGGGCGSGWTGGATSGGSTGTGSTGGSANGGSSTGSQTTSSAVATVSVRSKTLEVRSRSLYVKLAGGDEFARGTLTVRTRERVRIGRSNAARRTLAKGTFQIAADDLVAVRLTLTQEARSLLRNRRTIAATVAITPRGGERATTKATVRRPRTS